MRGLFIVALVLLHMDSAYAQLSYEYNDRYNPGQRTSGRSSFQKSTDYNDRVPYNSYKQERFLPELQSQRNLLLNDKYRDRLPMAGNSPRQTTNKQEKGKRVGLNAPFKKNKSVRTTMPLKKSDFKPPKVSNKKGPAYRYQIAVPPPPAP